jgi:hypothetical protein
LDIKAVLAARDDFRSGTVYVDSPVHWLVADEAGDVEAIFLRIACLDVGYDIEEGRLYREERNRGWQWGHCEVVLEERKRQEMGRYTEKGEIIQEETWSRCVENTAGEWPMSTNRLSWPGEAIVIKMHAT